MATITTCDGTGVEIAPETPATGHYGHQYCEEARAVAEKYLEDLDALHTRVAQAFQAELVELRALYREKLRQLPDEP